MIFLGIDALPRLGDGVFLADVVIKSHSFDLAACPQWLAVLIGTLGLALAIWIGIKVLKLTLWLVLIGVLLGGGAWAAWLFLG